MNPRSPAGLIAGLLAALLLVSAPHAQARDSAKFKVLSISGSSTTERIGVYEPTDFGSCSFSQTERITFRSTKRATGYAFTSKAHGRSRVAWSSKPTYTSNFTVVKVPGEMTISRSATYEQTTNVDPKTGETFSSCLHEISPVDCQLERTLPATLEVGGTSGTDETTYVELSVKQRALNEIDDACFMEVIGDGDDPGLFSRNALFKSKQKRVSDSDRTEKPVFDNTSDSLDVDGTEVHELAAELKRRKQRR